MSSGLINHAGDDGIYVQYSGDLIDSAVSLGVLVQPPVSATHFLRFTAGQNAGLAVGAKLEGATSAATLQVVNVVITSGTIGGSDAAGILFVKNLSAALTDGENLVVGASTYCVARSVGTELRTAGMQAKGLLVSCETQSIRFTYDGIAPTNSAATPASFGHLLAAGDYIEICGKNKAKQFQLINAVSTSNGVVNVTVLF